MTTTAPPPDEREEREERDDHVIDLVWRVTPSEAPVKGTKPHAGVATAPSGSGWLSTPTSSDE